MDENGRLINNATLSIESFQTERQSDVNETSPKLVNHNYIHQYDK